ncbi:MAG: GDP-mannose 4,6-dehydratase [Vulcanimicrobiota bacterium]
MEMEKNVRDWIYVEDNCRGIDTVFWNGNIGEIYSIGGSNERTNLEITGIILSKLGKDENWIEFVKDRLGHDRRYAVDSSKIKKLGWQPEECFEDAIGKTIQWYLDKKKWWAEIRRKKKEYNRFIDSYYKTLIKD